MKSKVGNTFRATLYLGVRPGETETSMIFDLMRDALPVREN
jgi:hypothetical protein